MNAFLLIFIIVVAIVEVYANIVLIKLIKRVKNNENDLAVFRFEQEHGKNKTHWAYEYSFYDERIVFTYVHKNTVHTAYLNNIIRTYFDVKIVADNCCWAIIKFEHENGKCDWYKLDKTTDTITWILEPAIYANKDEVTEC